MKRLVSFCFLGILFLALVACNVETSTSFGLTVQKTVLAKQMASGKIVPVPDKTFKRGERIYYVLLNVGKFKKDAQGLNWFDMNVQVKGPDGKIIMAKENLLGDKGHIALANDIARTPHGIFVTTQKLQPGSYTIKITIFDKIGKGSASKSTTFTLQ
ncbi:MAG: hypothetical protein KAS93_06510 [Gammaproteobacteria bacterium]|nr:hypothetical protein [Gammaproteobacteria bacterium]